MDENSVNNIKNEINPPSQTKLIEELYDPLAHMPKVELAAIRKRRRLQALAMLAFAIGLPVFTLIFDKLFFPNGSHVTGVRVSKNGIGALVLGAILIYLALRGIYNLMTLDRSIASDKRRGLLSMHPELQPAETERQKTQKDSPWPKRIIWIIATLPVTYTILFYVALWLGIITVR
jgi:hypothetical protein